MRFVTPVGVHPIPTGNAALRLRLSAPGDSFLPPDGGPAEIPEIGEVVFAQDHSVLTRRWTWRQAALTLTLPETTTVFFNIDALQGLSDDDVAAASRDVTDLVRRYCGGQTQTVVLNAANPSWSPSSN
jgi:DNA/RNA-binding domain of Phe-tRNA-synthetase-like protein